MSFAPLQLVLYGLFATLSPLGFAATLAVIRSGRFRALGFGLGFVTGQAVTCAALVIAGTAVVPDRGSNHPTFRGALEVSFGLAILWLAAVFHRRPQRATPTTNARSKAILERLERLRVGTALAAGLALGIGGPKRLVLTALAAASITTSNAGGSESAVLVLWYTIIATLLIWGPIISFEIFGELAVNKLAEAQRWLSLHQRAATFYALILIGVFALADGLLMLL
jgi:hypothetical protein